MAIELPHSIFLAVHKTGSLWVLSALRNAGLIVHKSSNHHATLGDLMRIWPRRMHKVKFATARNPITWFTSMWCSNIYRKPIHQGFWASPQGRERQNFNLYVRRMTRKHPGWLSDHYAGFFGRDYMAVKFILQQENLTEDLIIALHEMGEHFDEAAIRQTPIRNRANPRLKAKAKYSRHAMQAVFRSEYRIFRCMKYPTKISSYPKLLA